jgi:hypothetical protein
MPSKLDFGGHRLHQYIFPSPFLLLTEIDIGGLASAKVVTSDAITQLLVLNSTSPVVDIMVQCPKKSVPPVFL